MEAIYPRPKLSQAHLGHAIYPYLLRGLSIDRPDQLWAAHITYIRLYRVFLYMVAIMDWVTRYVIFWKISLSLEVDFCLQALQRAFRMECPEIFKTDQGLQFINSIFIQRLWQPNT